MPAFNVILDNFEEHEVEDQEYIIHIFKSRITDWKCLSLVARAKEALSGAKYEKIESGGRDSGMI